MMAFCGQDSFCKSFNSDRVLQRAKENAERSFPVVGVIENLNETLQVLEHRLPNVFKGALKVRNIQGPILEGP